MLYRLEIENFYSIRDPQVIDLRAAGNAPDDSERLAPLWKDSREKASKVVALFGANASGKSNVLKAMSFIAWFVKDSFAARRGSAMPFERFNEAETLSAPTRLAIELGGPEDVRRVEDCDASWCRYAYEFTVGGGTGERSILNERLYYWPASTGRKVKLFDRDESGKVTAGKMFDLTSFRRVLEKVLRPDASVICTLAQLEHPFAKLLCQMASRVTGNILIERFEHPDKSMLQHYASNPGLVEVFNREINRIDVGIKSMQLTAGPDGPSAAFIHEGLAFPMPLQYQSQGTRHFMRIYPLILYALETGGIAVVDELDATIHPTILPEILRWFQDPERNPHDAQIWLSCQNASLLEDLSKEEVFFCEKDRLGRTKVYGLRDIQSVRRKDNYYKKYLGGAFGSLPQIG